MSINIVILSGRASRPPKRVRSGDSMVYVFPLAVRQQGGIVFPMIEAASLPAFVVYRSGCKLHEQPIVTVIGRLRTRNLTRPLSSDLASQARRAGTSENVAVAIREILSEIELESRHVVTEIVADSLHEGGVW